MERHGLGSYQIDIKEVVQLSHEQLPIEEIEELEIVPQIVIEENGNEIEITGALILYGDYKGNQEAGKLDPADELPESYEESVQFEPLSAERGPFSPLARQDRFEYRIPVKISMPRNKVDDVDDVYAYINSFDYDLKTPYQIEVAASLMISGFSEKEELNTPFEFVHSAGDQSGQGFEFPDSFADRLEAIQQNLQSLENDDYQLPTYFEAGPDMVQQTSGPSEEGSRAEAAPAPPPQPAPQPAPQPTPAPEAVAPEVEVAPPEVEAVMPEVEAVPPEVEAVVPDVEEVVPKGKKEAAPEVIEPAQKGKGDILPREEQSTEQEWDNVVPMPNLASIEPEIEEKEEDVRVAITNKGTKKDQEPVSSLSSIFAKIPRREDRKEEEKEVRPSEEAKAAADQEGDNDALYLTNFMDNQSEQFTKLRICILQKNETIEEIAERYDLTVDSILRANSASRNQVAAGQLLYIPVKG
ncbi:LysM peptidoglycan-binding domain-containing protein [Ammoniphilus sp. CFH 90114]|uniref:LysM peptidoglycan-binding domain-containing protein n=1 Tax=Ammoniphilus sp. CFH 90114 TaxID=2493665 RepID=UPI001F0C1501|nr:LysM peptidoglycan-binding domain-containing protein [Ammoniphilus sp. CFH 90114]